MKLRIVFLACLLVLGGVLAAVFYTRQVQPPVEPTLTSAFQIFGETVRVVDRFAARAMPVDDLDEVAVQPAGEVEDPLLPDAAENLGAQPAVPQFITFPNQNPPRVKCSRSTGPCS